MKPFSAVLLAGGRSRRMGRDKALLPLGDGRLLWERQLALLHGLDPAETFLSGPARPGFPKEITLLEDAAPGGGPLAGLASALAALTTPRLLALAIDLPAMTAGVLTRLLEDAHPGIVPRIHGRLEPLAAVYPAACQPLAAARLAGDDRSLRGFVAEAERRGWVVVVDLPPDLADFFVNWNSPDDYQTNQSFQ